VEVEAGPGPLIRAGEGQLEPSRDGGNIMEDRKESIQDMMHSEDIENSFKITLCIKLCINIIPN
jgi:hypothetical protein